MDTISYVNQNILRLWAQWEERLKPIDKDLKVPLVYPELKQDVPLFVGMNPSLNLKGFRQAVKDTRYASIDPEEFYRWVSRADFSEHKIEQARRIVELAWERLSYFQKFREIARETSGDASKWAHVDLFFNQETNQKDFERKTLNNKDLSSFTVAQLDLSKKLINYVHPRAIVIANALASEVFRERLNEEFPLTWNDEYGYHTTVLKDKTIPVFLVSMLTGQRALDKGSYKRLKWHIKKSLSRSH